MNILVTVDSKEIIRNIDQKDIIEFIKNEWNEEDKEAFIEPKEFTSEELWEQLEIQLENEGKEIEQFIVDNTSTESILRAIRDDDIEDYVSNYTDYYISEDIPELMEKIHRSGNMDEVIEMFTIKY